MSMREIQHAVTIDESYNVLDEDDIPSEEILVAVCAGLINLDTKTGVVQLVHFTAQEYFSQPSVREKLFPDGHRTLFSTCLSYLVLESLGAGLPEQEEGHELDEFMAKHCLLYYAAHNWGHHARKADVDQADQGAILRLLASEQNVILLTDTLHMTPEGQHRRYYPNILTEIDKSGIWLASYFGLSETVKQLLGDGADPYEHVCVKGSVSGNEAWQSRRYVSSVRSALTVAAWNGHVVSVRMLLEHGAWASRHDLNGAVANQHQDVTALLLERKAPLDRTDEYGLRHYGSALEHMTSFGQDCTDYAPIHWAIKAGNSDLLKLLLTNGAVVNPVVDEDRIPLILAAEVGDAAIVELLFEHGARANVATVFKKTAMHVACRNGSTAIVKLLLAQGAHFLARDASEFDKSMYRLNNMHKNSRYTRSDRTPQFVMRQNRDQQQTAEYNLSDGVSALGYALKAFRIDVLQLLLKADSPAVLNSRSPAPLCFAAYKDNLELLELFLRSGADINVKDQAGRTALFWAVKNKSQVMTTILLAHGAAVDEADNDGTTPLHVAATTESSPLLSQLVEHGASINLKRKTMEAKREHWQLFDEVDFDLRSTRDGATALHLAAAHLCAVNVRLFVKSGADLDAESGDGRTVLSRLSSSASITESGTAGATEALALRQSIAHMLILGGTDVDHRDKQGQTALMIAAEDVDWQLAELLLRANADPHIKDAKGRNVVHAAFAYSIAFALDGAGKRSQRLLLEVLSLYGADFSVVDFDGYTPLYYAISTHAGPSLEILDLLKDLGANISSDDGYSLLLAAIPKSQDETPNHEAILWLLKAGLPVD